jgi:hypothetical protein
MPLLWKSMAGEVGRRTSQAGFWHIYPSKQPEQLVNKKPQRLNLYHQSRSRVNGYVMPIFPIIHPY